MANGEWRMANGELGDGGIELRALGSGTERLGERDL